VTKEGRFVARDLTYYIRKLKKNLVNENFDRFLTLSFDQSNRLTEIWYESDEGLGRPLEPGEK